MHDPTAAAPLRFGRFELQLHERRLLVDGQPVPLGGRAFDLLATLAARAGHLVGKQELFDRVWPGRVVEENNLAAQVSTLRKVLGPDLIASVAGRGYRLVARLDPAPVAPAPGADLAASALRTHLPVALPALIGRDTECAVLHRAVEQHRLVTLLGAGGIGKSLLARHVLAARRDAYPHGVCWVELSGVTGSDALPAAVGAALGLPLAGDGGPQALAGALTPLRMLVALDNAEHCLAGVAALCQALHDSAAGLHLLVTSQASLRIQPEHGIRLGALSIPDTAGDAEQALRHGAIALFAERARAVDPRFVLRDGDVEAVAGVCRRLDGLPLAIELAAARAPLVGLTRLAAALDERLAALGPSRQRDAAPRQQSLRAALEWSHALLSGPEQQVFRRLAVVAGSASVGFAQALLTADAAPPGPDRWGVLDAIDALVDRSLLALEPATSGDEPRLRWLESPQALARVQLEQAGELPALRQAHADAATALAEQAYHHAFDGSVGADDWERRLGPDLDNLTQALAWSCAGGTPLQAATLAATLLRALPASLQARRLQLADDCEALIRTALPAPLAARLAIELACTWADTHKPRSLAAAEQALALTAPDPVGDADRFLRFHALCRAASAAAQAGDPGRALPWLQQAQALEDPGWPPHRRVWTCDAALCIARMQGAAGEALRLSRVLVPLERARGRDDAIALGNQVDHALAAGDAAAAARSGSELVDRLSRGRDEFSLAFARLNLCAARLALGDAAGARVVAAAAWPQARAFAMQHAAACYLALLAALQGQPQAAARLAGWAATRYAERNEVLEVNERRALEQACRLARSALGERETDALRADGSRLDEAQIGPLVF